LSKPRISEPKTGREIDVIARSMSNEKGTFQHPTSIEVPELDKLPKEASNDNTLKKSRVNKVIDLVLRIVQSLMSILNLLVNAGWIKPH
jgi:hypothetical protein